MSAGEKIEKLTQSPLAPLVQSCYYITVLLY